jgi:hypothetical protein
MWDRGARDDSEDATVRWYPTSDKGSRCEEEIPAFWTAEAKALE